ncbi:MAG: hypothetical protein KF842_10060 [Caulobacter sp.]|nr:hypothetical protein [Caulobacter sp.]
MFGVRSPSELESGAGSETNAARRFPLSQKPPVAVDPSCQRILKLVPDGSSFLREACGAALNGMRISAAIQHIRHIAIQGLPHHVAIPMMVDALDLIMPARTRTFVWLDSSGQTTDIYERDPIVEALDAFNLQTPDLVARGEPSSADLVRSPEAFGGWRRLLLHPNWERSVMKNELFRPYGIGNNLDFPLRDQGQVRATLLVGREPGSAPFTRTEIQAVLGLRPHFLHALNTPASLQPGADLVEREFGLAVIAPDGHVSSADGQASKALYMLDATPGLRPMRPTTAPATVMRVIESLARARRESSAAPPSADISTRWGDVRVVAHVLTGSGETVVSFRRLLPVKVGRLERLRTLELAPREREVALIMCEQTRGEAIAARLGMTTGAYRQYAKRIYARLNVEGREGVVRLLDRTAV